MTSHPTFPMEINWLIKMHPIHRSFVYALLAIDDCTIHRSQKSILVILARGIRAIYRRWSMRTSASIDLSFRSVDLIPWSLGTSLPDEMHEATRANAHSAAVRFSGREKGREREWEMYPDGTVSFTCMRTIPRDDTVTSMRLHRHACSVMISGSRDTSVSRSIDTLGRSKMKQYPCISRGKESFDDNK